MNHNQKRKLARKMLTREEIKKGVPIFQSEKWSARAEEKAIKEDKKRAKAEERRKLKELAS